MLKAEFWNRTSVILREGEGSMLVLVGMLENGSTACAEDDDFLLETNALVRKAMLHHGRQRFIAERYRNHPRGLGRL